ncbi:MAG: type I 3-dehydroquinate dehydratase, partial [Planctomycetales bacterium]
MICVSIGRSRHQIMRAEHQHLADQGAELVELRVAYLAGDVKIPQLLADRPCRTVITCRRPEDGGKFLKSELARQTILRTAITENADFV